LILSLNTRMDSITRHTLFRMNDSQLHLEVIRQQAAAAHRRSQQAGPVLEAAGRRDEDGRVGDPVTVRFAAPDDTGGLARIAELDSAALPAPPLLVGERAGRPVAALSLADGSVVADPFVPTADVVALLALRARQLRGVAPRRRARRRRVVRWRPLGARG